MVFINSDFTKINKKEPLPVGAGSSSHKKIPKLSIPQKRGIVLINLNNPANIPTVRVFIEYFAKKPALCRNVVERIGYMFYGGMDTATFYLYPPKKCSKSKFHIRIKRAPGSSNVWSFIIVENGKDNLGTYKKALNVEQTLQAILDVLEGERN